VAEGIETRRHAEIARTLGATIAQGYLYGRPGVLPTGSRPTRAAVELLKEPPATDTRTPFEIVAAEPGCCWPASRRPATSPRRPGSGSGGCRRGSR
jgi:hypothetical protein